MSYQINRNDINYNIPIPPAPRACTTYTLMRYFWKTIEFVNFVVHVLPDHVNRPLDITVIPEKFNPNELYAMRNSIFGMCTCTIF